MAMGVLFCFKDAPPPDLAFINNFIIALRSLQ